MDSCGNFKEPVELHVNWLEHEMLIHAIPKIWLLFIRDEEEGDQDTTDLFHRLKTV